MKRFFVLAVLILSYSLSFAQGWEWLNPLPQGNDLIDLEYLGENQLLSAGYYGTAIISDDGGEEWSIQNTGENPFPSEMVFFESHRGVGLDLPIF